MNWVEREIRDAGAESGGLIYDIISLPFGIVKFIWELFT